MGKTKFTAGSNDTSERLDLFISARAGVSRSSAQRLIRQALVQINSHPVKASYRLRVGDIIELRIPEEPKTTLLPEDIPLDVIHEDRHIIAINKPAGIVIYPAAGHRSGTLLNGLIARCDKLASAGSPLRPGVVHRIDKDTSGAILFAKDDNAYHELARQFQEREIQKTYLALVFGNPRHDAGNIRSEIGRSLSDRKKMSIRTRRGKEAITEYEVLKRFSAAALVRVLLITGRTHQIRVHFSSFGHPVLGDSTYGRKAAVEIGRTTVRFKRQMLHAHQITFRHPASGKRIEVSAPLPEDMKKAITALEGGQ